MTERLDYHPEDDFSLRYVGDLVSYMNMGFVLSVLHTVKPIRDYQESSTSELLEIDYKGKGKIISGKYDKSDFVSYQASFKIESGFMSITNLKMKALLLAYIAFTCEGMTPFVNFDNSVPIIQRNEIIEFMNDIYNTDSRLGKALLELRHDYAKWYNEPEDLSEDVPQFLL